MNFVQQLEECLRDLAAEARKKHPGVKEASERATLKLRTLKNSYVSAVRKASSSGQDHPTTRLFQSSDLLHPFLLAANYPNATNNLLEISFRAMKLLMEADAIVPSDGLNLVRVWMIQAQVVTAYYQKLYGKELSLSNDSERNDASSTATISSSTSTSSGGGGGGWFSWGASGSSSATATQASSSAEMSTGTKTTLSAKNAVSSSSGQTGQGSQSPAVMERLAIEILSCLLQLLELLKNYPDSLTHRELWTNAVALASLWLYKVPARHKVRTAAQATTVQVLTFLFQQQSSQDPLVTATWEDLLSLAAGNHKKLTGAFCQKATPQPEFALQLMTQVWQNAHYRPDDALFLQTLSVTVGVLSSSNNNKNKNPSVRIYPWSLAVVSSRAVAYPNECREILVHMLQPIAAATDTCRRHDDFEDGFVYTEKQPTRSHENNPASLFPAAILWKAGLALEMVYLILDSDTPERAVLLQEKRIVASLAEALSHFATIGASCRDHMLQVIDFLEDTEAVNLHKPTILRKAEQIVLSENSGAALFSREGGEILGECLWIAFQGILRIAHSFIELDHPSTLLEETFAPFLAILQHYMKRFVGSKELVELALKGYSILADVCLPLQDCLMQRKALLTSLSKLSLPSWGKHDPSCQLQDHHVRSLLCLLKLVHMHYDSIASEWDLILWTLEELSMLNIASPLLSDEAYHSALAISAVYDRFAKFSTCLSDESLILLTEALADICESTMRDRDIVGDTETVLIPGKAPPPTLPETSEKGADGRGISSKIASMGAMGVKVIYGTYSGDSAESQNNSYSKLEMLPAAERTKHAFYEDYRQSFVQRISASAHSVRISSMGRVPFAVILLSDVAILNTFRSHEYGQAMSAQLSRLAASIPAVRPYVMDIMTLLIMSQLSGDEELTESGPGRVVFQNPMLSQLLASERIQDKNGSSTLQDPCHVDVFSQLCETIRTTERADIGESALSVVSMILQGSGHRIRGNVWSMIIKAVSSMSGDPSYTVDRSKSDWADCGLLGFRCLKLIVDDFLDELPSSAGEGTSVQDDLLDCCSSFVSAQHDVNTSLTAIGLLWTIADRDSNSSSIDRALSKLVLLTCDNRAEVRNAAVNTLFSCIVGRGSSFAAERWKKCFTETIFGAYENVARNVSASEADESTPPVQPAAKTSRYLVSRHHSRDSASKQWIATQVVVLRGLTRVLRSFFRELLDTTDSEDSSGVPWFQDSWVKILDCAWEAASQDGDRESLDIRSVGVELLGICCQLASQAGIEAATTPARVGTNMEVVNGALRSVRETTSRATVERSHSIATDMMRQKFFLEAFESLESFNEVTSDKSGQEDFPDDIDLQVLHKFCSSLTKVFECCKNNELKVSSRCQWAGSSNPDAEDDDLEQRFVSLVAAMLEASSRPDQTRFLNQAQRCSLDLLSSIASEGSSRSFEKLVAAAGSAFFFRKDTDEDESDVGNDEYAQSLLFLNHEAAAVVSSEMSKGTTNDECVLFVFYKVLLVFQNEPSGEKTWRRRSHHRFIPIAVAGLKSASTLSANRPDLNENIRLTWSAFAAYLSSALSPVKLGNGLTKIPRVAELHDLIEASVSDAPSSFVPLLCKALANGLMATLTAAKQHAEFVSKETNSDICRKLKKRQDELVQLFKQCFDSCCRLGPEERSIIEVANAALLGAVCSKQDDPTRAVSITMSLVVCEAIQARNEMQRLVISLFPTLMQLVVSEEDQLKTAASAVFKHVDVSRILEDARDRYEKAEKRAAQAEQQVEALKTAVDELQRRKR